MSPLGFKASERASRRHHLGTAADRLVARCWLGWCHSIVSGSRNVRIRWFWPINSLSLLRPTRLVSGNAITWLRWLARRSSYTADPPVPPRVWGWGRRRLPSAPERERRRAAASGAARVYEPRVITGVHLAGSRHTGVPSFVCDLFESSTRLQRKRRRSSSPLPACSMTPPSSLGHVVCLTCWKSLPGPVLESESLSFWSSSLVEAVRGGDLAPRRVSCFSFRRICCWHHVLWLTSHPQPAFRWLVTWRLWTEDV